MKEKKKKSKQKKDSNKAKHAIKLIIITILVTLFLEFCYVMFQSIKESTISEAKEFNEKIINSKNGYFVVGSSNFKYSMLNKKTGKYEKPRLAVYNEKDRLEKEFKYQDGYNGLFSDAIEVENGYLAVGFYQKNHSNYKNNAMQALIVYYDQEGKIIWEKSYEKLTNTKFKKILATDNGYIVVGSSNYQSTESGDEEAGAFILKYDKNGNILWEEYYGDNKTGSYNDVIEVEDGYIVVGSKDSSTGILAKYDTNGLFKWKKELENVGENGLSKVIKNENQLFAIGSFKKSTYVQNRTNTALLVQFNTTGDLIKYVEFGEDQSVSQWNDFVIYNNTIYTVGVSSYINEEQSKENVNYYNNKAIYAKYDINLKLLDQKKVDKKATYQYTSLIIKNNQLYITGYTNAKCDLDHADGKNYVSFIEKLQIQ